MTVMTKIHAAYSRELLSGRIIGTTYLVKIIALTRPPVRNQQRLLEPHRSLSPLLIYKFSFNNNTCTINKESYDSIDKLS